MLRLPVRSFIFILCMLLAVCNSRAQKKTVLIEPQKRQINQDALLPAQTYFNVQLPVSSQTAIIEVNVYKGKATGSLLEHSYWVRPVDFTGAFAELPLDLKLKGNSNYSFEVSIYNLLDDSERVRLKSFVQEQVRNYVDATIETEDKGMDMARKPEQMLNDLNATVSKSLSNYKTVEERPFEGFSDIVKMKIQQLSNARLKNAAYNVNKPVRDSALTDESLKASYAAQLKTELQQVLQSEIGNYLNLKFVQRYDHFVLTNQYTEKTQSVLPLFVGYGAVYLDGNIHDLSYDAQPYAGFSIPLGRGDSKYFSRTTFIMGVFLRNFKDANDSTITGPIVDRPVFAGLGFRIYDFIHLNAGMVATSTSKQNLANIKTENIKLRPFVGLTVQFNLWLGVNKK